MAGKTKQLKICNNSFYLNVTKDRLCAFLTLYEADSFDVVEFDEILREIQEHGIVFGFVSKLTPPVEGKIIVAKGKPAVPGEKAKIISKVKPTVIRSAQAGQKGKDNVNFRELGNIVNVPKDQLLLEKVPPTKGSPGKDVYGREISTKPGKDIVFKCGPGVVLSGDGLQVIATVDGKFVMDKGKPTVAEEHVIQGDVDLSVGNVGFCGKSLVVEGEVLPGFKLKCRGDIRINGKFNNGKLLAGGNLELKGGIIGEDAVLKVKGDATVDFIENVGDLEIRGDLTVTDFVVQCNIKIAGDLVALEGKGTIIGGNFILGGSMHVKELGSVAHVVTEVTVGMRPEVEMRKKRLEAEKEIWPVKMNAMLKDIGTLNAVKKKEGSDFSADKAKKLQKLNEQLPEVIEKINVLTEMEQQLDEDMLAAANEAIFVYGPVFPGVYCHIGPAARVITDEEHFVVIEFRKSSQKIHVRSMTADEKDMITV